ncbi:MAG: 2'-5' RNA ligase family protein [Cytophagales bacterium]|nr:2'-5' RNA ligase family protein [Cytophagales bacterium]
MEKKNTESLYFLAIVPPEPLQSEVYRYKEQVREKFGSRAALNSPAHITLHMPFKWKKKNNERLFDALQDFAGGQQPFEVELNGFGFFEPRVVFVGVDENDSLRKCQKALQKRTRPLQLFQADYKQRGFHPHITIAFRDLKKPLFYEARAFFEEKEFSRQFVANGLVLLKHSGKRWEEYRVFGFSE